MSTAHTHPVATAPCTRLPCGMARGEADSVMFVLLTPGRVLGLGVAGLFAAVG